MKTGFLRSDKIFDETAVVGVQEFASRLQNGLEFMTNIGQMSKICFRLRTDDTVEKEGLEGLFLIQVETRIDSKWNKCKTLDVKTSLYAESGPFWSGDCGIGYRSKELIVT